MGKKKEKSFKILSLDGGGFAGVTAAKILSEIGATSEDFDLVAGTSTGAILGAGLRVGLTPAGMLKIYEERGEEIFPAYWKRALGFRISAGVFRPRYSAEPLKRILWEVFEDKTFGSFGNSEKTIVTAYDIKAKEFVPFRSWKPDFAVSRIRDLVLSSASAPVYFPPNGSLVDGGIVVNNPTMIAVASAVRLGHKLENIKVLSIGTGFSHKPITGFSSKLGAVTWGTRFPSITLQGTSQVVDYQAEQILETGNYFRLNTPLKRASDSMDSAGAKQFQNLLYDAEDYLATQNPEKIRGWLLAE
jgi:patatin-like phospholipase/acyl hydrolase